MKPETSSETMQLDDCRHRGMFTGTHTHGQNLYIRVTIRFRCVAAEYCCHVHI